MLHYKINCILSFSMLTFGVKTLANISYKNHYFPVSMFQATFCQEPNGSLELQRSRCQIWVASRTTLTGSPLSWNTSTSTETENMLVLMHLLLELGTNI